MVSWRLWTTLYVCLLVLFGCRDGETETSAATTTTTHTGGEGGAGGVRTPMPLRIMNWNVKNFYNDELDDPATMEELDPNYEAHRSDVGNVVRALASDIVVFSEIENQAVIDDLNALELDDAYPHRVVIDGNDPRGIDVGVMSKVPFDDVITHKDESFTKEGTTSPSYAFSRDALEVHFTFNGRRIVLLAVHYKAKENDNPDKRLAEAQRARAIADALAADDPQAGLVILGDFNDLPGSPAYLATAAGGWINAADAVPEADRWTFQFNGNGELVDHQFVNPLLGDALDPSSVRILHAPEVDAASDHAPLVATYDVR